MKLQEAIFTTIGGHTNMPRRHCLLDFTLFLPLKNILLEDNPREGRL